MDARAGTNRDEHCTLAQLGPATQVEAPVQTLHFGNRRFTANMLGFRHCRKGGVDQGRIGCD